jgi:hypothetical protein
MSKSWLIVILAAAVPVLYTISNPHRLEHRYSPAFRTALKEAVERLEGRGARRTNGDCCSRRARCVSPISG